MISLTVEANGRLPGGLTLAAAIEQIDHRSGGPQHYMLNCAHPEHVQRALGGRRPVDGAAARHPAKRLAAHATLRTERRSARSRRHGVAAWLAKHPRSICT